MIRTLLLTLSISVLISACQDSTDHKLNGESIDLQRQATEEVAFGIAEENSARLDRAKKLIEQSLEVDPNNHEALLNRAQVAVYRQNYDIALRDVESAVDIAPKNDSLLLFRCILIEEVEGNDRGKECYSTVEKHYAERHGTKDKIPANWVGAAILADAYVAPELVEAYLEQERNEGQMEAEMAIITIESLQNGSYVDQVLMRKK